MFLSFQPNLGHVIIHVVWDMYVAKYSYVFNISYYFTVYHTNINLWHIKPSYNKSYQGTSTRA